MVFELRKPMLPSNDYFVRMYYVSQTLHQMRAGTPLTVLAKRRSKEIMMRRVTTHDIAREAGVSRTTVSHVLNNHPGIILSPKTRQRVLATARKLGYVPNSAAQMLVTGLSQTIGLILSRPDLISVDAFVPMLIGGLNEACRTRGYRLLMETIEDHHLPTRSQNGSRDVELKRVCGWLSAKVV